MRSYAHLVLSIIFMATLSAIRIRTKSTLATSSYGAAATAAAWCHPQRPQQAHRRRNVVIVETSLRTHLNYLLRILLERQPASIRIVTLLDKPDRRGGD